MISCACVQDKDLYKVTFDELKASLKGFDVAIQATKKSDIGLDFLKSQVETILGSDIWRD
jgi:hypothetical protein